MLGTFINHIKGTLEDLQSLMEDKLVLIARFSEEVDLTKLPVLAATSDNNKQNITKWTIVSQEGLTKGRFIVILSIRSQNLRLITLI